MEAPVANRHQENVRIGPISILTLIVVICMAVLAVLSISTAQATEVISHRSAEATTEQYRNERTAQEFVAELDDLLGPLREEGAGTEECLEAVAGSLEELCAAAEERAGGEVSVTADVEGSSVVAEFTGAGMKRLNIAVGIREDGSYRIEKWKASGLQQEAAGEGSLWMGT